MKEVYIYTLSDSNGNIRYVGKTLYPKQRLYAHIKECKSNRKSHKISWIKSLLNNGEKPIIEIIDIVSENNWEFWEQFWIEQLKSWGYNLTNLTSGGMGGNNYKHTDESKIKMRHAKLGGTLSEEHKKTISQSVKDKFKETPNYNKCCDKHILLSKDELYRKYIVENLSLNKCASYFNCSKKTIFKHITEYNFKKSKDDWKHQLSTHEKKKVLQYDLSGNLIKEWSSLSELGSKLNINKSNVANCCRGIAKTCVGYIWKYANNI